jgi:hypothetical protein
MSYKKTVLSTLLVTFLLLGATAFAMNLQNGTNANDGGSQVDEDLMEQYTGLAPAAASTQMSIAAPGINPNGGGIMPLSAPSKTMYGYNAYASGSPEPEGPVYFALDNPGDVTSLAPTTSPGFISGGTWTNDDRWIGCRYSNGDLWEIDPSNGDMTSIGGGGAGLNGLAFNPVTEELYGAASYDLYEIDIDNGAQTHIGAFGGTSVMIGIAFDSNGVLYGWDVMDDKLWTIDTSTGAATEVGPLMAGAQSLNLLYAQDGAFDYETDTLYLTAWTVSPTSSGNLYECDEDTGDCTLVGAHEGGMEITASAIPYESGAIEMDVDIKPKTLNQKSNGKWVTVHLELSGGHDVNDIDISTVELEGIPADWGNVEGDSLMVKFSRAAVIDYISNVLGIAEGDVELTVTANLLDGTALEGSDTIRVIHG